MRWIDKKREPKELIDFKSKLEHEVHTYKTLKNDPVANPAVQIALAKDQGYICCYCMGVIPLQDGEEERPVARIGHFKPRSVYDGKNKEPDLRIEYSNLFLACENEHNHCDIKKDDDELCEEFTLIGKRADVTRKLGIQYTKKCIIYSTKASIHQNIGGELKKGGDKGAYEEGILNLNCKSLINARSGAWRAVSRRITKLAGEDWNKKKAQETAKDFYTKYSQRKKDGKFYPYYGVILYQLEKRFKELKSS